jgi:dienelactone hydrolase
MGAVAWLTTVAQAQERVAFPGPAGVALQAHLFAPASGATSAKRPAIVALHGCGGNVGRDGRLVARVTDWSTRWTTAGFLVVWPDSFGSRGLGPQCTVSNRDIRPADRAFDALAALTWLQSRGDVDPARVALVGWSNGASATLHAAGDRLRPAHGADFKAAIAFYPGCRGLATSARPWSARLPLTILMGGADDWTPPEPCRELGQRANVRYVEYPGAFHDFDNPASPIRARRNLAFTANGTGVAHTGTDPAARAAAIAEVTRLLSAAFTP